MLEFLTSGSDKKRIKILFVKVAYMKRYQGIGDDDKPKNGGSYVVDTGNAFEKFNFKRRICEDGKERCFGFFETKHNKTLFLGKESENRNQLHIEKINDCSNFQNANKVEDVLVVFCSLMDGFSLRVVGWYKHATVYRKCQKEMFGNEDQFYFMKTDAENATLLSEKVRDRQMWKVPSARKDGFGFGQSMHWFANDAKAQEYVAKIIKNIEEYKEDDEMSASNSNVSNLDVVKNNPVKIGQNIIFYGVPGSGKSYKIKTEYCNDENFMERVVFHPDYTYSDFVGQILPQNNEGHISYSFTAGPFAKILRKAYRDTENNYFLVVEELNRGNAPAIFGDVFQLLDRNENGESEYGINNSDIAEFVYGDKDEMVKIPSNLFILATMNTADQNVFTLDTAFKRRWKMCCVCNDVLKCNYVRNPICNTEITWKSFMETINKTIVETAENNIGVEDKRLGVFFVSKEELQSTELFGEKVLMYLWTDVFKFNHDAIFKDEYKTLEDLLKGFQNVKFGIFNEGIKFEE